MVNRRVKWAQRRYCLKPNVCRVEGNWRSLFIGTFLFGMSACSSLESLIIEPEMSDLQLTVATLKTSLRDAQRLVDELRTEVDARRQELADVQIVRAQLEGQIREAEHQLTEARHVIDLQREELSSARSEREQMGRTRASLQNQLKHLQKQLSNIEKQMKGEVSPAAMGSPGGEQSGLATPDGEIQIIPGSAIYSSGASSVGETPVASQPSTLTSSPLVFVKFGDTLWSLARRYHTSVSRLMTLNALSDARIQVGQVLWWAEPPADEPEHERIM